jgi:hypothetical protein
VDSRQFARRFCVDRADDSVRDRAAHKSDLQHTRWMQISDKAGFAAQKRRVFEPKMTATDETGGGSALGHVRGSQWVCISAAAATEAPVML